MVCVLAVSDEVDEGLCADLSPVRGAELIVACGDLPFDYLGYLMNGLDVPLVFVPGNHDPDLSGYRSSRAGLTLRAGMPVRAPWPDGAVNVDRTIVPAAGLRIAGLGGCPRYSSGPNQYSDRQLAARARALRRQAWWGRRRGQVQWEQSWPERDRPERDRPERGRPERGRPEQDRPEQGRVDVLLTHAPPRGVGDGSDPAHRGFAALHPLVAALRPGVLLHGHVLPCDAGPPERSERRLGRTTVLNVTGRHLLDIQPGGGVCRPVTGRGRAR
jgi:hypothetical protein